MATGLKNLRKLAELSPRAKVTIVTAIVIAIAVFQEVSDNFQIPELRLLDLKVLLLSLPALFTENYQALALGAVAWAIIFFLILKLLSGKKSARKSAKNLQTKEISDADAKKALKAIDSLLDKLPEKEFERFSKTKDAVLYKKVMKKFGVR